MDGTDFALLAAVGIPSLALAFRHGDIWEEANPDKLGFKWGYFVIYSVLISYIFLFGFIILTGHDNDEPVLLFYGVAGLAASAAIAYFSIQRQRWALIVSTILTLNPLLILINFFYLKNRWSEFSTEGFTATRATLGRRIKYLPRDVRIALFVAIVWIVCVPAFVFLFQPYGRYMNDDDIIHLLGVILLPIALGIMLFFIYKRFVK